MAPHAHYTKTIERVEKQISKLKRRLFAFSMARLAIFLATTASIVLFFDQTSVVATTLALGIVLFLILVDKHAKIRYKLRFFTQILDQNQLEIRISSGDFSGLRQGLEYVYETHDFNQDIDLFGDGSLFQTINRTATKNGEKQLANWLNSNDIHQIKEKQDAVQEISEKVEWRQNYTANAALIESDISSTDILTWMQSYEAFTPQIFKWFPILFSSISLTGIFMYWFDLINGYVLLAWFFLGLGITGRYLKKVTTLYNTTSKVNDLLEQYAQLLLAIEQEEFESPRLQNWKKSIETNNTNASYRLKELAKEIDLLSNRNNMIFAPLANGFLLWDLRYSYRIENWMGDFESALRNWFSIVEKFDAINSFGNYAFNHNSHNYPEMSDSHKNQLYATNLGHPLLNSSTVVKNTIEVNKKDYFIITGANMAGKSTFLRTVAVNLLLANCGLPVCATTFIYRPIKLISSMRTSDSLLNDESYFFSELKRLKIIVEAIKKEAYFIILDEILKGTNSKDKAEGSKKFIEKLTLSGSTGMLATHDLSICALENKLPQVKNYYFEATILKNELYFDYKFKKGICQNMNASFLLHKMQII